jgi:catechol 2,3-dioxygenase-like lactoylglutathione lyase family enzyme
LCESASARAVIRLCTVIDVGRCAAYSLICRNDFHITEDGHTPEKREKVVRIRHLGIVVQDLERTAEFYENVLGFKRLGDARTPGHYPGKALDLSDGEVNYSLLQPNPEIARSEWTYGAMGPNHIGVTIEDTGSVVTALKDRGIEVYGAEQADPPRFFKFRDPDGVEVDVATPERGWKF